MIALTRDQLTASDKKDDLAPLIVGVGNAGVNLADRLVLERGSAVQIAALNTDRQSLVASVAPLKFLLGEKVTRGMGAGGDPELGQQAFEESASDLSDLLQTTRFLLIAGGLGGGTATALLPNLAQLARQRGVFVAALVTLPFAFEGKRRAEQAQAALLHLRRHCDIVLVFANDRMVELSEPRSDIGHTFAVADQMLASSAGSLISILGGQGPWQISLADLRAVAGPQHAATSYGYGLGEGGNRAHIALETALRSPLLDRGRLLDEASAALIHVHGPRDLQFSEVQLLMHEVSKLTSDQCRLHFGVSLADSASGLAISILAALPETVIPQEPIVEVKTVVSKAAPSIAPVDLEPEPEQPSVPEETPDAAATVSPTDEEPEPALALESRTFANSVPLPPPQTEVDTPGELFGKLPVVSDRKLPVAKSGVKAKQETLQFEPVARGRFEKSEPTIIEGEDLDVPTFLRLKLNVK